MIEVLYKEVDFSLLTDGCGLPSNIGHEFTHRGGHYLSRGESKVVTIIFNGVPYDVKVINLNNKIEERKTDQFQLRYKSNKKFILALQATFHESYSYIMNARGVVKKGTRCHVKLPEGQKEFFVLYKTNKTDVFEAEAICLEGLQKLSVRNYSEVYIETLLSIDMVDPTASVQEKETIQKIRKLDRKIAEGLKVHYGFRCQICGQLVGERYGIRCCESHHIDYFSKSWNNDSSNQMILCPSHHRIIHSADPFFKWSDLSFNYRNGVVEKLSLNDHLVAHN